MNLRLKEVAAAGYVAPQAPWLLIIWQPVLFSLLLGIVRDNYHLVSLKDLSNAQKLDLARSLRYEYRSSNGQIRRLLGLSQFEVDSLFPGIRQDPAGQKIPPQKVPSGQGGL